jgi:hypothetical protein
MDELKGVANISIFSPGDLFIRDKTIFGMIIKVDGPVRTVYLIEFDNRRMPQICELYSTVGSWTKL